MPKTLEVTAGHSWKVLIGTNTVLVLTSLLCLLCVKLNKSFHILLSNDEKVYSQDLMSHLRQAEENKSISSSHRCP